MNEQIEVYQGDVVSYITNDGEVVRGIVEVSGLDSESDIMESMENAELPKDKVKVFTYPDHLLVDKTMDELKLLDRALLLGDIVRRGRTGELGTVVGLDVKCKIRVLDTAIELPDIDSTRFHPFVRLSEGDKVANNGWIGSVRELEEDKIDILTQFGMLNLDDDSSQVSGNFRLLSSRGVYEPISDWRRNEEDGGVYIGQQLHGAYGKQGDGGFGKVLGVGNGDAEVAWIAFGNHEVTPMPKNEWYASELWQLQAPWLEDNVAHTETNSVTLGARYKIQITQKEAKFMTEAKTLTNTLKQVKKEKTLTGEDVMKELVKLIEMEVEDSAPWIKFDFGNYSVVVYESECIAKFDSERGERVATAVNEIFDTLLPQDDNESERVAEVSRRIETCFKRLHKILGKQFCFSELKIHLSDFSLEPMGENRWRKFKYLIDEKEDLSKKLRGQGHSKFEFKEGDWISLEVTDFLATCEVQWQGNRFEKLSSIELLPALHVNDHDYCPGDFVVRESRDDFEEWGNVLSVDFSEKELTIQWHKDTATTSCELLSVFDVVDHPDFKFRLGELVVGTDSSDLPGSGVGMIKGIRPSGKLDVLWADKTESLVFPVNLISEHVLFADAYEDLEGSLHGNGSLIADGMVELSGSDDDNSWDTESNESSNDCNVASIKAEGVNNGLNEEELAKVACDGDKEFQAEFERENSRLLEKAQEMIAEITTPAVNDVPLEEHGQVHFYEFPSTSHAYYKTKTEQDGSFLKIYNAEIKRLQSSLPKGIHVWTYESRVDLFSFLIEGPKDTPYEECLFSFDVSLPIDYPLSSPPKVHFKSALSQKINPNLYETGNVCLSLLGTWAAKRETEDWTYNSNLLQLLVSLQGLTLNAEPYYNEAGYEKQRETESGSENSKSYNEFITVKLCDHVISTIRNPGDPFQSLTNELYFQNGGLERFIRKMERISSDDSTGINYTLLPVSKGCKTALKVKLEKLKNILEQGGEKFTSPMV